MAQITPDFKAFIKAVGDHLAAVSRLAKAEDDMARTLAQARVSVTLNALADMYLAIKELEPKKGATEAEPSQNVRVSSAHSR